MAEQITAAEELVRALDEARREVDRLDSARRELRLGRHVGRRARTGRLVWLKGVYGFGWLSTATDEAIPLGDALEVEFYTFLTQRLDAAGKRARDLAARLADVEVSRG